jgi:hypothetical protein
MMMQILGVFLTRQAPRRGVHWRLQSVVSLARLLRAAELEPATSGFGVVTRQINPKRPTTTKIRHRSAFRLNE